MLRNVPGSGSSTQGEGPESGSSKAHSRNREVKTWEMAGKERKGESRRVLQA